MWGGVAHSSSWYFTENTGETTAPLDRPVSSFRCTQRCICYDLTNVSFPSRGRGMKRKDTDSKITKVLANTDGVQVNSWNRLRRKTGKEGKNKDTCSPPSESSGVMTDLEWLHFWVLKCKTLRATFSHWITNFQKPKNKQKKTPVLSKALPKLHTTITKTPKSFWKWLWFSFSLWILKKAINTAVMKC